MDGGFIYSPTESKSPAGNTATGGLRSYASMTYAGLKSFIYAGMKKEDPRVQAAMTWIKNHYSTTENPGMGQSGLFYYYQTFAKALSIMDIKDIETTPGTKHDWRKELIETLAAKQTDNGSWINTDKRWLEGDARLVTAYALLALGYTMK
jgi:squalene-hopene/tetraprenyl-beta-curcumene cyclase